MKYTKYVRFSEIQNIQNNSYISANIYQDIPIDKRFKNFFKVLMDIFDEIKDKHFSPNSYVPKKIYVKSNFYLNLKIKVIFKTDWSIEKYRDINTL